MAGEKNEPKSKRIINVKRIALITVVIAICLFLLGGSSYLMMKWIVERISKTAKQYTHDVSIDSNGNVSTAITAEELWNNMKEQGYEIDKYLSSPEELAVLMNAELVTQLPDTRGNVDSLINWDALLDGKIADAGSSSKWAVDSPEYINHLKNKLIEYDQKGGNYVSHTNLSILIDNDNCRVSIFQKSGDTYNLIAGWNCYCGYNGINTKHVNLGGFWGDRLSSHGGPRTLSQKGVYHVASKVYSDRTCFVTFNHGSRNTDGTYYCQCQQIHPYEFGGMDADKDPVENRFMSAGCTEVTQEQSQWIHDNCPEGTRVVVFDKYNPMPEYNERDESSEIKQYSQDVDDSKFENTSTSSSELLDENGMSITEEQYLEHAKKVDNFIWSSQNKHLYWHGGIWNNNGNVGMAHGGDICAYTNAIDILWNKDYTIKDVHSKISELDPDILEIKSPNLFFFNSEKVNEFYNIKVGKTGRTVDAIKESLNQGKVVAAISNSGLWLGGNPWNNGSHWGVIFYFDGTHFHMKAGGTGHIKDGLYTPKQLEQWLNDGSNSLTNGWKDVYTFSRGNGSKSSLSSSLVTYVRQMKNKIKWYEDHTTPSSNYIKSDTVVTNDIEKCLLLVFKKENGNWVVKFAGKTFNGANKEYDANANKGLTLQHEEGAGTRSSKSYKAVTYVDGKLPNDNDYLTFGNKYVTCFIQCIHNGTGEGPDNMRDGRDHCQRFEYSPARYNKTGLNPSDVELEYRHCGNGCTGLSEEHAKWIYENVPVGATVIAFDEKNPMPRLEFWDSIKTDPTSEYWALSPEEWNKIANSNEFYGDLTEDEKRILEAIDEENFYSSLSGTMNAALQGIIRFKRHDQDGNEFYLTYADPTVFQKNIEIYNNSDSSDSEKTSARNFVMTHFTLKENPKASRSTATGRGTFTAYNLTENQVYGLARICAREQGTDNPKGAAAEASLMANLFEKQGSDYGSGADGLYNYVTQGFWFRANASISAFHDCPDTVSNEILNAVKAVLIQGYRTVPRYVTEHDWLGDIGTVTNNGVAFNKYDHSQYQQGVTQVHQDPSRFSGGGATWTFYAFFSDSQEADPFGFYEEDKQRINDDNCYSYEDIIGGNLSSSSSSTTNTTNTTDSSTDVSTKLLNAAKNTPATPQGYCLAWVDNVYESAGFNFNKEDGTYCCAYNAYLNHGVSTDLSNIPVGAAIYGTGSGEKPCGTCGNICGHVGIYIGNGQVMDCVGYVRTMSLEDWSKKANYGTIDGKTGILGWGWEDGNKTRGLKGSTALSSSSSIPTNYTGKLDYSQSGDGYASVYTSSAGLTFRNYKQYEGSYQGNGYRYPGTINSKGCLPTSMSIIASGIGREDLTPPVIANTIDGGDAISCYNNAEKYMNELGWNPELINGPSADTLRSKVKEGNVLIIYSDAVGSAISWGDHYSTVVDINDKGEVFVINPGIPEGDPEFVAGDWISADRLVAGGGFFMWAIDAGSAPRSTASEGDDDSSAPGYQAVIGTFREVDKSVSTGGPNVEGFASDYGISLDTNPEYTISTTTVNYEDLVQPYVMKFDFLCAMLVISQNKNFVIDLAKLAYNSDLEISIFDTVTTTTDIDNWTYTEATDGKVEGYVSYTGRYGRTYPVAHDHIYGKSGALREEDGFVNKTVITRTNTVQYALTKADAWYINYTQEYSPDIKEGEAQGGGIDKPNEPVPGWQEADLSEDKCGKVNEIIKQIVEEVNAELQSEYDNKLNDYNSQNKSTGEASSDATMPTLEQIGEGDITNSAKMFTRTRRVKIHDSTSDKTDITTYTPGTKSAIFKDCNKKELSPNFVTLYNSAKYRSVRNTIEISWLLEIMEANDNLANITQIFKYLWYKATNQDLGVTELDATNYYPGALNEVSGSSNSNNVEATTEVGKKVVELAKSKLGCPYNSTADYGPNAFCCSGLTWWIHQQLGIDIPRRAIEQVNAEGFEKRPVSQAEPGDILWTSKPHVGIYIGNNKYIHANVPGGSVREQGFDSYNPWEWALHYVGK